MDEPGITILIILFFGRVVFSLNASESGYTPQKLSPQSYKNTICPSLTGDNPLPPPRSQQTGMGSNAYGRFLALSTNKKTYNIVNPFLDVTWAGGIGMSMGCAAVWRVELFSFFILDFHNERAVQWGLHMLKPQHQLEGERLLRAGLIRKDLHLHNNPLSYVSICLNFMRMQKYQSGINCRGDCDIIFFLDWFVS